MKVVLDTNILISALISKGLSEDVLDHVISEHTLVTSRIILKELDDNLDKKFRYLLAERRTAVRFIEKYAFVVESVPPLLKQVSRDRSDDHVLSLAHAEQCDVIISGDMDLLVLKSFQGIPIHRSREYWNFVFEQKKGLRA